MTITIIGVGLIGGSLAISLKENEFADTILGVDIETKNLDKALRRRIIDEACTLEEALKRSEILVLSTPMDVLLSLLPEILDKVEHQVVIDVGSTKEKLLQVVKNHPKRGRLVATHPMAGTEFSGPEAAIPNLFDHKCTVLCDTQDSDTDAVALVEKMYQSLPMSIVYMDSKSHDLHTAYVSHISHLTSFALALTVLQKEKDENRIFELASGGFASTVRLAKSSPAMWTPIFKQNKTHVLDVLNEHIQVLSQFKTLMEQNDFEAVNTLIERANVIKRILK